MHKKGEKFIVIFVIINNTLEIINIEDNGDFESFTGRNKRKQKPKEYILEDETIDFP